MIPVVKTLFHILPHHSHQSQHVIKIIKDGFIFVLDPDLLLKEPKLQQPADTALFSFAGSHKIKFMINHTALSLQAKQPLKLQDFNNM